jgi:ssDNA-binding Zn-finger/Zn-ribbon topoisomerase 1
MSEEKKLTAAEKRKAQKASLDERIKKLRAIRGKVVGREQREENKKKKGRIFILGLLYAETFKALDVAQQQVSKDVATKAANKHFKDRNLARALDALEWLKPAPATTTAKPAATASASSTLPAPVVSTTPQYQKEIKCPKCGKSITGFTSQHDGKFTYACTSPSCNFHLKADKLQETNSTLAASPSLASQAAPASSPKVG